jgi:hypothetical protein
MPGGCVAQHEGFFSATGVQQQTDRPSAGFAARQQLLPARPQRQCDRAPDETAACKSKTPAQRATVNKRGNRARMAMVLQTA